MARIMVVEDDEKISKVICLKLTTKGYESLPYFNGADAWEGLQREIPDLILLDVLMPRLNGFELLSKIKESKKLEKIPVIFLSSVSQEEDVVRGLEMGANDYIIKPFSFPELLARIKKWI